MIYLDYAAHTQADSAVLEEFCRAERQFPGNPISKHEAGRRAYEEMENITSKMAAILNVKPSEIIYTSGASEANNLALKGLVRAYRHNGKHILSTCLEHPSISGTLTALREQGYEVELIDILPNGKVDLGHLESLMRQDTVMISVCHTDSELGAIQPIDSIAAILKKYTGCKLHVDASQAMGKLPVSFENIDCLSFAPHKFHGICGCGVLLKKDGIIIEPLIHGGASSTIYRSGTPAVALTAAAFTALEIAQRERIARFETVRCRRNYLTEKLIKYPLVKINSPADGSPYILNISVTGVKGEDFQAALDKFGICVSVKSACSVTGLPSRPVLAITKDKKNALCSWRISFSHITSENELDGFMTAFDTCYKELTAK